LGQPHQAGPKYVIVVIIDTTQPPTQNIAFFTAHPDDHEMMLAYHTLDALAAAGPGNLYAYVATDGTASTLGDPAFVHAGHRRQESQAGLTRLGLAAHHLHYPGLPDGQLSDPAVSNRLAADISAFITAHHITRAVTLGPDGGDHHPDHISVHNAVAQAAREAARAAGQSIELISLSANHTGARIIKSTPATRSAKLAALACHPSQFPDVTHLPDLYRPYLEAETYDHTQALTKVKL